MGHPVPWEGAEQEPRRRHEHTRHGVRPGSKSMGWKVMFREVRWKAASWVQPDGGSG